MAKKISSLSVVLGATVAPFVNAFKGAQNSVNSFVGSIKSAGSTVLKFTGIAGGIGTVFAAFKGAASGITLAAQLEQVGVAFETMLGSGQAAQALMDQLTKFSAETPFEFPEIAATAKKLLAFGVGASDMIGKLKMLGDISAGIGAPLEDIAAIYGKIKSRGQLTGETLNQMAERGIPIYRALADTLHVSQSQVAGLVTAGKIGFPQVDAALGSLTKTGGQFAGMMEKQSHTLAGLWSTLTDNIGLAAAGLVKTIVDAFGLREALAAFTNAVGSFGSTVTGFVSRVAPIMVGFAKGLWSGIVSVFTAIYNFIAPIMSAIGGFIISTWQTTVQAVTGFFMSLWNATSGVFTAIWGIVTSIGESLVQAWNWAMNALGLSSLEANTTIGGVFDSIYAASKWFMDGLTLVLNTLAYSFTHWRDVAALAATEVALFVVRTGNQIQYTFTEVIPSLLDWFASNWRDIFTTLWNYTTAVFTNMGKNIANFFTGVWSMLKGDGFDFQWTALTEGFESTLKELPKIAQRQVGPLEKSLQDQADTLKGAFQMGLGDYLNEQARKSKSVSDKITKGMNNAFDAIRAPVIPPAKLDIQANTQPLQDVGTAAQKASDNLKAMFAGSAEAQQAMAAAVFAQKLSKPGFGQPTPATPAGPAAAPVNPAAVTAMRDGADIVSVLKSMLTQNKDQSGILKDIAGKIAPTLASFSF